MLTILVATMYSTGKGTVDLTLNPKDKTYELTSYGTLFKGTYDETNADYRLYPSLGFMNSPIGVVMVKTDREHITNNIFGSFKFVRVDNSKNLNEHMIENPTAVIKFVPDKG